MKKNNFSLKYENRPQKKPKHIAGIFLFVILNVFSFSEETAVLDNPPIAEEKTTEKDMQIPVIIEENSSSQITEKIETAEPGEEKKEETQLNIFYKKESLETMEKAEIFREKQLFFEKDIVKYEVLSSAFQGVFKLEKKLANSYVFKGNDLGFYSFIFFNEFGEKIKIIIEVKGKKYNKDEINKLFQNKNFYEGIKEIYMYAENTLESQKLVYEYLKEKCKEKDNIDFILNSFLVSKMFLKNFEHEQKEFLEKIYLTKKNMGDVRAEVLTLSFLKKYDKTYEILHGKRALETGINEKEAMADLEKAVETNLNMEAAKILGLYYLKNDIKKAEKFLFVGDKKEFFMQILKKEDEEKYLYYYEKLKTEEKVVIDEVKSEFQKDKIIELYIQKGHLNTEGQRFDVAKEYYNKVIELSRKEEVVKIALFNLGKVYILEENYEKALELFDAYLKKYEGLEEVEALFYLGLCNFKLKNLEKSDIIFNQIKKTYKYSIWDEKIKILLKEI